MDRENVVHKDSGRFSLKKNASKWTNFENIILNGISQLQKDKYYMIPLV